MHDTSIVSQIENAIPAIRTIASKLDGHTLSELTQDRVDALLRELNHLLRPIVSEARASGERTILSAVRNSLIDFVGRSKIQQRMISKPQGYSGDYLTIDWLYQQPFEGEKRADMWNRLSYAQQAARAVRARIEYVRDFVLPIITDAVNEVRVLDLACGPGRIERCILDQMVSPTAPVTIELLDADEDAIEYARTLLSADVPPGITLQFHHRNALRFTPASQYQCIWSAGLFDYLDDRHAARLLGRMYHWLASDGMMLIGNFAPECESQWSLEAFYDWHLIYRSESDCLKICKLAGIPIECITLSRDATNSVILVQITKTKPFSLNSFEGAL